MSEIKINLDFGGGNQLDSIIKQLETMKSLSVELQSNLKKLTPGKQDADIAKATEELKKLSVENAKVKKTFDDLNATQEKSNKTVTETTKTLSENIALRLKLQNVIKSFNTDLEEDLALYKKSIINEKELKERRIETITTLEKYKARLSETNKAIKEEITNNLKSGALYKSLSKDLNNLRNTYKDLALQGKANTKEGKEMLSNIIALDKKLKELDKTVGQNQRNTGGYTETFEKLKGSFLKVTGILAGLGLSFATFKKIIESTELGADKFKATMTGLGFSVDYFFRAISTGNWDNLLGGLGEAYERGVKFQEGVDLISKRTSALDYFDAKQKKQMTELEEAMRNKSLSDRERLKAGEELIKLTEKEYERRKDLAEQDLINSARALDLTVKVGEKRRKMTTDEKKETIAFMLEQDALNETLREDAELYNKELEKLKTERNKLVAQKPSAFLGITQQDIDLNKEANQKLIDNYISRTDEVAKYAKILRETEGRLSKEQLDDIKSKLTDRQKAEYALYQENKRNVNTYHSLQKELRDTELAEEEARYKRLMELQRMRVNAYEIDVMKEMSLERLRYLEEIHNLEKTYKTQLELNQALEYAEKIHNNNMYLLAKDLQIKREELNIDSLSVRTKEAEDELDALIKSRNEAYNFYKESREKQSELDKKAYEDLIELGQKATNALISNFEKQAQAKTESINKQIESENKMYDLQLERAKQGKENTLVFEQEKLAQLELARQKAAKKEQRWAKIQAFLNLLSSYAKTDANTALSKSIRDMAISSVVAGSFKEGVIGFKGKGNTKTDSNIVAISKDESIIKANMTDKFREPLNYINENKFDKYYKKINENDYEEQNNRLISVVPVAYDKHNKELIMEIRGLREEIKNKPVTNIQLDNLGNIINEKIEKGITYRTKILAKNKRF